MNARFYRDIDGMLAWDDYNNDDDDNFSLWKTLWEFAEAMWLTGHEEEESHD